MRLLLVICLLGAGGGESMGSFLSAELWRKNGAGMFGKSLPSTVPPVFTVENRDAILDINGRLFQENDPDKSIVMEGDILKSKGFSTYSPRTLQWPKLNGFVTIPYVLSADYEPDHRKIIQDAFNDLESATCLRFVPRTDQRDFILIEPDLGCYAGIGRTGKKQLVSLSFECLKKGKGVVLHELMHVAGFWHEHSRADRDLYIYINGKSIMSGYERNFCKFETTNMLVNYAYDSILHYSRAFSKDGSATILPIGGHASTEIGQRVKLSISDILRVNKYYYCPQYTPSPGDHEILTRDSPPVAFECPQATTNEEVKPNEGVFSKTAPAINRTYTNISELSSTSLQSTVSPTRMFSYTEISKRQTTLNGISQEEIMFNRVSVPALTSNTTQPISETISETSSHNLSSGEPTPWSTTSMAVSTVFEHQSRVGDVWNASDEVVTGFAITGDLEETTQFNQSDKFVIGCSGNLKKHSTTARMGCQEEIPSTKTMLDFIQETPMPASEKQEETTLSTQSTNQLPNKTFVNLVSTDPVASPATTPELQLSTREKWDVPMKSSTYADTNKEKKESIEIRTAQGTFLTTKTSTITSVVPAITTHLLSTVISQTSVIVSKGTKQKLEKKDSNTQTSASPQSTLAQTTREDLWKPSAHVAYNYTDDPDYANLSREFLKVVIKRSLPEPLHPSESGESYGSSTKRYQRWIHENLQTHSHTNARKAVVVTLGNKVKRSRSALHNLFSQITVSASLPTLHEVIRQMPYLERSSKMKTNSESVCGFEHGLCGWKQSINDDFDWSLSWGSLNPYTGYFKPGGFHLSLKSSPKDVSTEQKALLLSPIIQPFSCMSFWYGSRHSIMGTLNVYILSSTGEKTLLWSTGGQDDVGWTKAQLKLPPHPHPHDLRVVVEGKRSPSSESNTVIDNLFVGKCK
ncbi:astacin-like metalloendopeptidase isoform X2 [Pseudophryne corroboree]|uniref:astacin-like metalloendopeptidase isoform X2 n=1 Tax=Pseudophryne corroboree TaxID=495146 RepID=UPI00308195AD